MKITIQKNDLLKGLTLVQGVVEKKKTLPILSNVLLETNIDNNELVLTATDLEIGIKTKISAEIINPGKITISAKKLFEIVKELTDNKISLETKENNWVEIINDQAKFNIVGLSSDEFPLITEKNNNKRLTIKSNILKNIIDKTFYAISNDESKFNLNGIYFHFEEDDNIQYMKFIATDGHRLALVKEESSDNIFENNKGIIFPKKGLSEIRKILDQDNQEIFLSVSDNNAIFQIDNTTLVMRLIDGDFPDYKRVIPEKNNSFCKVTSESLLHTLRRVSILANEKSKGINIEFSENEIKVTSSNPEYGEAVETIKCNYNENLVKVGFNSKYLIDVISNTDCEINIYIKDNISPCLITPADSDKYSAVIMPMRI